MSRSLETGDAWYFFKITLLWTLFIVGVSMFALGSGDDGRADAPTEIGGAP